MVSRNTDVAWHHADMEEHAQYRMRFGCQAAFTARIWGVR